MPIKINMLAAEEYANIDSRFDACVRGLAPLIRELREDSKQSSTRKLAKRINALGESGPNGKPISFSTMRRILLRLPQLHLGRGPRNRSEAASNRTTPYTPRLRSTKSASSTRTVLAEIMAIERRRS